MYTKECIPSDDYAFVTKIISSEWDDRPAFYNTKTNL